jgi:hypothetical protein
MSARVLAAALAAALVIAPLGLRRRRRWARRTRDGGSAARARGQLPGACDGGGRSARGGGGAPTDPELEAARIAWRYFERNYHPATGLVNSVDGYPNTTMWDLGATVFATLAARELGLVDGATFDTRIETLLWTLAMQPLFQDELPNKAYDAATGRMADYANKPTTAGIGFSAIDLARLASSLSILAERAPEHRVAVARVLARWRYCRLLGDGELHGAIVDGGGRCRSSRRGGSGTSSTRRRASRGSGSDVPGARLRPLRRGDPDLRRPGPPRLARPATVRRGERPRDRSVGPRGVRARA